MKAWLTEKIGEAIDQGFSTFISGMAMGVDLWAAEIVIERRKENPAIHLIAATPYPTFSYRWKEQWKQKYKEVWEAADYRVEVCKKYSDDVFMIRNRWMVDHSALVIACYNGTPGGTRNTIEYAEEIGIRVIKNEVE